MGQNQNIHQLEEILLRHMGKGILKRLSPIKPRVIGLRRLMIEVYDNLTRK